LGGVKARNICQAELLEHPRIKWWRRTA